MNEKKPDNQEVETVKFCPLRVDMKCENCRLYIEIPGFKGERECAFIISAVK